MLIAYIILSQFIFKKSRLFNRLNLENSLFGKIRSILTFIDAKRAFIKKTAMIILIMCSFLFTTSFNTADKPKGSELAQRMIENTKKIECMTYHMKKTERINGKLLVQKSIIKLNRVPFKVLIKTVISQKRH